MLSTILFWDLADLFLLLSTILFWYLADLYLMLSTILFWDCIRSLPDVFNNTILGFIRSLPDVVYNTILVFSISLPDVYSGIVSDLYLTLSTILFYQTTTILFWDCIRSPLNVVNNTILGLYQISTWCCLQYYSGIVTDLYLMLSTILFCDWVLTSTPVSPAFLRVNPTPELCTAYLKWKRFEILTFWSISY